MRAGEPPAVSLRDRMIRRDKLTGGSTMPTPRFADATKNKADPRVSGSLAYNVVFIPWEYVDAGEWIEKTNQWNSVTANKFEIVWYTPGVQITQITQANDHPHASIYIRGHGAAGVADIQVKVDTVHGVEKKVVEKKIHITEACDRLIRSGLSKSFAGAIKFFHCYSGTVMTDTGYADQKALLASKNADNKSALKQKLITRQQYDAWKKPPLQPNKSIGRTGAEYMRNRGYRSCLYFGYLGPLVSEYADNGAIGWHKNTNLEDLRGYAGGPLTTVRASLGRVQV
jgi:hypothetical protein